MTVSLIIPVYNALTDLLTLVKSLGATVDLSQTELILVDDCSTEFDCTKLFGPPFSVVRNPVNLGYAKTCNVGAGLAHGDVLVFMNSDIQVTPGWMQAMLGILKGNVGIVGPRLVFPFNEGEPMLIQSAGGLYDAGKGPYHRYIGWNAQDWRVNRNSKVSWITGAVLMIPRDLFEQVGRFDEDYVRGYFEDADLCEKVKALGYEVWYCADALMVHAVGHSTQVTDPVAIHKAELSFRNNMFRFHDKWDARITPDAQIRVVPY